GLAPVSDAAGWTYRFERAGDGWRIAESFGKEPAIAADLAFAIGAGLLDRAYAARVGELMWFAPLEVHARAAGRATEPAPGPSMRAGTRFTLPIAEECLACHTDRLPPRDFPLNLMPDPAAWQATGISCGACHESAEAHETWRASGGGGTDPIRTASH